MTNLEFARQRWEREGWGEPRDDRQRDLWIAFFVGKNCTPGSRYVVRHWTRPAPWIEALVRA